MLEYTITILDKVSFSEKLFKKELQKSVKWLEPEEVKELYLWVSLLYGEKFNLEIEEVFINQKPAFMPIVNNQTDVGAFIEYHYVSGYIVDVIESINQSVGQLKMYNAKVKIGVTSRMPEEVFSEHCDNYDWDKMIVIYSTPSKHFFNRLSSHLHHIQWMDEKNTVPAPNGEITLYAMVKE